MTMIRYEVQGFCGFCRKPMNISYSLADNASVAEVEAAIKLASNGLCSDRCRALFHRAYVPVDGSKYNVIGFDKAKEA